MIESGVISQNIAKSVFDEIVQTGETAKTIVQEKGLVQISDSDSIEAEIESVLAEFPAEVNAYLEGKEKLLGFFMGQVMRAMKGKGNPNNVNEMLRSKLEDLKSE